MKTEIVKRVAVLTLIMTVLTGTLSGCGASKYENAMSAAGIKTFEEVISVSAEMVYNEKESNTDFEPYDFPDSKNMYSRHYTFETEEDRETAVNEFIDYLVSAGFEEIEHSDFDMDYQWWFMNEDFYFIISPTTSYDTTQENFLVLLIVSTGKY